MNPIRVSLLGAGLLACLSCTGQKGAADQSKPEVGAAATEALKDWPHIDSAVARDEQLEARIKQMLAEMSLAQKIGQMTQVEINTITPEQVREYYIGSVLNGGGSWPGMNKHAAVKDWLALADRYHDASMNVDAKVKIPIIWGIDAVHGNSNVYGATLFPHNVGLGAAHDAELIGKIGEATAQSTRATGIGWVFAPTLAVAQNTRWGRSYESFSSDPALVKEYASAYVKGLQGDLHGDGTVVATAKHFIGDGATDQGKDQGNAIVDKATMINVHGQGYYGALAAGVQTVMASYNSWDDVAAKVDYGKMHGARALLTEALKDKMGFDGFVVSDWNGIGQVPGCSNASCAKAINAGIDMVMVPDDWKAFIANTTRQVESGEIPMSRIDDAVTRILRVKLRAGLFEHKPSDSQYAGKDAALQHRDLARRAVRESLVLLKNEGGALPLKRGQRVLVVGKGADSLPNQAGGWSLTWQGTDNANADYPNADSIVAGFREALGADNVTLLASAEGADASQFDAVVAVIGETPYAEMMGDIVPSDTVAHSRRFPEDLAILQAAAKTGKPVITVFLSGRPLYANDLLNLSNAFVAAWLPGTEGKGVADVLVAGADGKPAHDFRGRLTFPWPNLACPAPNKPALFKPGYGLGYANAGSVAQLPLDKAQACGDA
ncbi:MAG TPA: glycoside hydrolase family 3 protein, partial [Pseudoxanthomonas sp.]|nr:glycoside hydrolase family 3 protein [Pseudoxanthomonas sp.]